MIGPHQERTERAAQQADGYGMDYNQAQALWQIAHSLAVIADNIDQPATTDGPEDIDALVDILVDRHGGKLFYPRNRREFEITAWLLVAEWRKWA